MKFNFRKIVSVLASTFMVGSTVAMAAAVNYPAPFVQGGSANVNIVWGSAPGAQYDFSSVIDIQSSLAGELAKQTATSGTASGASTSGGDSVNLGTSARKLYYADAINAARTSVSSSELPNVLADGKVTDLKGTEYGYTQSILPGASASTFGTSGGDLTDPDLIVQVGTDTTVPLYNYSLSFTKNINVSDDTNVQGQKLKILGVDYIIGASSTNTTLYLYGAGESLSLAGGETKTVNVGGIDHIIDLVSTSTTTTAKLTVDGVSKTVAKGSSYSYAGDFNVYVKDITHPAFAGDVRSADLIVGANTLKIMNGQTVKSGADATVIKGTYATIAAAGSGQISGINVGVAAARTQTDHIPISGSFTDPVFGGLKLQFADAVPGLNDSSRAMIKVSSDNNQQAYLTLTTARAGGKEDQITYGYDNNTASNAVSPFLAHQLLTSNKGYIHVVEGENAAENDWVVINQGDSGTIVSVDSISVNDPTATISLSDVITGDKTDVTLTNSTTYYTKTGVNIFGGNGYTISSNAAGTSINMTWNSGTTAVFPRIKLKDGGWVALLTQKTITNGTSILLPDGLTTLATTGNKVGNATTSISVATGNGIAWVLGAGGDGANSANITGISNSVTTCQFNASVGPAVLYIEPKKWNDGSYGNFICIPMTTTGTTELAIGQPLFNGTNSGFTTYNSDTYKSAAIDQYGAFVTYESRTNENGVATIETPSSQMFLDLLFTASSTLVSGGSSGGNGQVRILGNIAIKDSEVSSAGNSNLIVVGGSCVNTQASLLIDPTGNGRAICGADWTTKTNVSTGQWLIQTFSRGSGQIATLVAGYDQGDTANAAKALTTQTVDVTAGKKHMGQTDVIASSTMV